MQNVSKEEIVKDSFFYSITNTRYGNERINVKFVRVITCAILLAIMLVMGTCSWSVVPPGHRGIAVTLGTVQPEFRNEGLNFKIPFFTNIHDVSIQQQTITTKAECYSSDTQSIVVTINVMYRLPESKVVELYKDYKGDPYPTLVEPRLQAATKSVTANYTADKLIKSRDKIKTEVLDKLREATDGIINITDISIANIDLSDQLEKAIETKMIFEQEALAMTFKLDKANKDAEIKLVEAKAESEALKIKGEALKTSPTMLMLEAVRKWNGILPTTVVTGGNNPMILPIDK